MLPSIINVVGNANLEVLHGGQHANAKGLRQTKKTGTDYEAGSNQIELRNTPAKVTKTTNDANEHIEIPSTSKPRPTMTDSATSTQESDAIVEIRVGDKILKLDMNISKWLQTRKKEIVLKKRQASNDDKDIDSQPSQVKIDKSSSNNRVGKNEIVLQERKESDDDKSIDSQPSHLNIDKSSHDSRVGKTEIVLKKRKANHDDKSIDSHHSQAKVDKSSHDNRVGKTESVLKKRKEGDDDKSIHSQQSQAKVDKSSHDNRVGKPESVLKKRKGDDDKSIDSQQSQAKIDKSSTENRIGKTEIVLKNRKTTYPSRLYNKYEPGNKIDMCIRRTISTMIPPLSPHFEHLSPADQSLKAFFDSMLRSTQRLPLFHQRRIRGDLQRAIGKHSTKVDGVVNAMKIN